MTFINLYTVVFLKNRKEWFRVSDIPFNIVKEHLLWARERRDMSYRVIVKDRFTGKIKKVYSKSIANKFFKIRGVFEGYSWQSY